MRANDLATNDLDTPYPTDKRNMRRPMSNSPMSTAARAELRLHADLARHAERKASRQITEPDGHPWSA